MQKTKKTIEDEVLKEYPPAGKYRIRLVANSRKPGDGPLLDIREYVSTELFEGFTRRGIRISDRAHLDLIRDVLMDVLGRTGFAKPAPGMAPVQ